KTTGTAPRPATSTIFVCRAAAGLAAGAAAARQTQSVLVAGLGAVPVVFSLGFALLGAVPLAGSDHLIGASLLGLAAIYGGVAVLLRSRRESCTLLWGIALLLGAAA